MSSSSVMLSDPSKSSGILDPWPELGWLRLGADGVEGIPMPHDFKLLDFFNSYGGKGKACSGAGGLRRPVA